MAMRINLNADLGESFGAWTMGRDADMLSLVDSANVACGFHAGDPLVMRRTVALARERGVSIGAHPAFPDLAGFGRRRMDMTADELQACIVYQVGALMGTAAAEGHRVTHVKPHGALNNMACDDLPMARQVAAAVRAVDRDLILLAPALSALVTAGREAGLAVVEEIFADRNYTDDGALVPRRHPQAMVHGAEASVRHIRTILEGGALVSINGKRLPCGAGSICVHGDNAEAVATARAVREALQGAGWTLASLPAMAAAAT
ncbi:MAG: LamB/YcsF family protein [Aquabacterium sp.]